jgi:hypothetical protein
MRASFFAAGLFVLLWGASFLVVDKVVLHMQEDASPRNSGFRGLFTTTNTARQRVFDPPDWAAFSLLSVGSVTMLYSIALPGKKKQEGH